MRIYVGALTLTMVLALRPQAILELPAIHLRVTETIAVADPTPRSGLMILGRVKCDLDGNVYIRHYSPTERLGAPIEKITAEGKMPARFDIRSAPGFEEVKKVSVSDFAVASGGEFYFLAARKVGEREVVRFTEAGRYDSSSKLEPYLYPQQLAIFRSGEFLVSGEELSYPERKPTGRPLLALYDRSGKFLMEVSLPRDIQWQVPPEHADTPPKESPEEAGADLTTAEPGDDGNIYLMRPVSIPVVYVISPGGSVLHRFEVPPPGEGFRGTAMRPAGGMIAIQFAEDTKGPTGDIYVYSVIDAQTGEKFADYAEPRDARGIWACYSPNGFTFLSAQGNPARLTILKAKP